MDTGRLGRGEKLAAAAAVALLILMFFPWFGISTEDAQEQFEAGDISIEDAAELTVDQGLDENTTDVSLSAWESFGLIDILLLITIIAAVGLAASVAASRSSSLPMPLSAIVAGLGILSAVLVLYRIIDPPYFLGREFWVFIGLLATLAIAAGGWMAMQDEGTSFGSAADQARDRMSGPGSGPGAPPPPPPSGTPPSAPPPTQ